VHDGWIDVQVLLMCDGARSVEVGVLTLQVAAVGGVPVVDTLLRGRGSRGLQKLLQETTTQAHGVRGDLAVLVGERVGILRCSGHIGLDLAGSHLFDGVVELGNVAGHGREHLGDVLDGLGPLGLVLGGLAGVVHGLLVGVNGSVVLLALGLGVVQPRVAVRLSAAVGTTSTVLDDGHQHQQRNDCEGGEDNPSKDTGVHFLPIGR